MEQEMIPGKRGGYLKKHVKGGNAEPGAGRPKGSLSAKTIIRKWLEAQETAINDITGIEEKLTQLDLITLQQIVKAKKGDTQSFNALLDRTEGKPMQGMNIEGQITNINSVPLTKEEIKEINAALEDEY